MNKTILVIGIIFLFVMMSFTSISGNKINNQNIKQSGRGDILYVGGSGPGNYTKIQEAIDDASDGDTIFVFNGTYNEFFDINKSISLIGENKNNTIIKGSEHWSIITITADWVNISEFTITNGENGIYFSKSYGNFCTIIDCKIDSIGEEGIYLFSSENNMILDNIFTNYYNGIYLRDSSYNFIINNSIGMNIRGRYGIVIGKSSNNNIIKDNKIFDQFYTGINIATSNNNIIINNDIWDIDQESEISLYDSFNNSIIQNNLSSDCREGIYIYSSGNNIISLNNILGKHWHGIEFVESSENKVMENNIVNNKNVGIESYSSYNNTIYHNNLVNNKKNSYQAEYYNSWDNGYPSGGNYWDDYNGIDSDGDGIGDAPYNISGGDNEDRYPLMEPYNITKPIANFSIQNDSEIGVVTFDGSLSYDIDGEIISYKWDYGDGTTGNGKYGWHQYCSIGTFYVTLTVTDNHGLQDNLTKSVEVVLVDCPGPYVQIDGPKSGNAGVEYTYSFIVCDVYDETYYSLLVDWGNGQTTAWAGIPGLWVPIYLNYSWSEKGNYTIRAKAKDLCREGQWTEFEVIIPRNKATTGYMLLLRILERFPLLQKLIQQQWLGQ